MKPIIIGVLIVILAFIYFQKKEKYIELPDIVEKMDNMVVFEFDNILHEEDDNIKLDDFNI
jgi:hypothetical protein